MPRVAPGARRIQLDRHDGGLNLRDAPSKMGADESPEAVNVTLDERGGVTCRLGLSQLGGLPVAANATFLYYSQVADALLAYVSTDSGNGKLYKSTDAGSAWSLVLGSFTAGAQAAIVDFVGVNGPRVVLVNTIDGVYSFAADLLSNVHTAGGSANMTEVRGSSIAVWQNKLWVTGDPRDDTTHSRARVWFSNGGNEQAWTVASAFVDIRDVDTLPCTAIGAGQGMDVTGKPSLIVYKESSTYRINDSTTGSYTTLHNDGAGACSNKAVAEASGMICSINKYGIWVTDGLAVPRRVSGKIEPLFTPDGLDFTTVDTWAAGTYRDRVVFSVRRAQATKNDLMIEYHPTIGWIVAHVFRKDKTVPEDALEPVAVGPMAVYTKNTQRLLSMVDTGGTYSNCHEVFKTGQDGTTIGQNRVIKSRYQTPWVPVVDYDEARLRALRVFGRGQCQVQVRLDFADNGDAYQLDFTGGTGFLWGTGQWGTGAWGEPAVESSVDVPLDQVCKHVSLVFSATTSTSAVRPKLLGDGNAMEVGAWAVYGLSVDVIPLGT